MTLIAFTSLMAKLGGGLRTRVRREREIAKRACGAQPQARHGEPKRLLSVPRTSRLPSIVQESRNHENP